MSQRNRTVFATFLLMAALVLAAPPPSHATALQPGKAPSFPAFNVWERACSWLAALLPDGVSSKPMAGMEKEGGAIDPNGRPTSGVTAPSAAQSDQGSPIPPNGAK
jgi:hypothetical protein